MEARPNDDIVAVEAETRRLFDAWNTGDIDYIAGHYAEDATRFHPAGELDCGFSAEARAAIKGAFDAGFTFKIQGADLHGTKVIGDVAIVTGVVRGDYFLPDGTPGDKPLRVSYVWVKEGGEWKELHHHASVLA